MDMTTALISSTSSGREDMPPGFASLEEAVAMLGEDRPIEVLYPAAIRLAAQRFLSGFAGEVLYAVKCNPAAAILQTLREAGIDCFDVASVAEIETVRRAVPDARMSFMHPVKNRRAIRHAYLAGIRTFAIDSHDELEKIREETAARDLTLIVRLALPRGTAALDLSGKFGIAGEAAADLLRRTRPAAHRLGLSFHVGSQCLDPGAYAQALRLAREAVERSGVPLDLIDVGGGFPVAYPGMAPPPLESYFATIAAALDSEGFGALPRLCEPGRALVAEGGSVLARVELRKGDRLYLNDGTYGALFDAGKLGWRYPVRRVGARKSAVPLMPFRFFGPTCDSMDVMEGPFHLPADIAEGDWIEIRQLGAYGAAMRTRFNGFESDLFVIVEPGRARRGVDRKTARAGSAGQ